MGASLASYRIHPSRQRGVASIPLPARQTPHPTREFACRSSRWLGAAAALTGLIAAAGLFSAPTASAALPTPVSAATARGYLATLDVRTENRTGYDRDLLPHWITISGTCNTRETILKRDGSNVRTDSSCATTGATWSAASDGDIDHLVSVPATRGSYIAAVQGVSGMPTTRGPRLRPGKWCTGSHLIRAFVPASE